jgi:hypothetical protein
MPDGATEGAPSADPPHAVIQAMLATRKWDAIGAAYATTGDAGDPQ